MTDIFENFPLYNKFITRKKQNAHLASLYFQPSTDVSNATLTLPDGEYINFSGYNYINTSGDPRVNQAVIDAVNTYGTSVSASRIVSGEKLLHQQLEKKIAELIQVEDSIVFTGGHATNVSAIATLFGKRDLIVHDAFIHNSGFLGARYSGAKCVSFAHNDTDDLERVLEKYSQEHKRILISTEGLFSMDGDIPDIPQFIKIKKRYNAILMVDEAHSFGVLGKNGFGVREHFNFDPKEVDIWMGTLSKALASCGGYIAGSQKLVDFLKFNADGFVYSAGISPANAAAALAALNILEREPLRVARLHENCNFIRSRLQQGGVDIGDNYNTPIIPVMTRDFQKTVAFCEELLKRKILIFPLVFPSVPKNKARLRLFINSMHSKQQLALTADTIIEIWNQLECQYEDITQKRKESIRAS